jgi:glycosyltransferase involved in cell wall biosynthesis
VSNVLFVLYHDFSANSAVHVHNFANELARRGHSTAVAYPAGEDRGTGLGEQHYRVSTFAQIAGDWHAVFNDGRPPDVVHAWTPRENVRLFCEKVRSLCAYTLIIHLEDNEELILAVNLGSPFEELARATSITFPANLSHPQNYRQFLETADGVTMIMDRLEEFVPAATPRHVLWPGADRAIFYPRPKDAALLASLSIDPEAVVLCYTGNVHSANAREVRSLYVAAAVLVREGTPATLVRTGKDFVEFLGPDEEWARSVSVDLGYVDYDDIARVLSLADLLVQPGAKNEFNEYRLPGKLPEFFAMGIALVLAETNVGRFVRHGEEAWVLPKVDALAVVDAVQTFRRNPQLAEQLGRGAYEFSRQRFDWATNTAGLEAFYNEVAAVRISA